MSDENNPSKIAKRIAEIGEIPGFRDLEERMKSIASGGAGMAGIAKQLADQQERIKAMTKVPGMPSSIKEPQTLRVPEMPVIRNPLIETNERLGSIEGRFEEMLDVMAGAANIANGIQAHAADFLGKFEQASQDTDRSASKAIKIGLIALAVAVVFPVLQIGLEIWKDFRDDTPQKVAALQSEIASVREAQSRAADKIAEELKRGNESSTAVLKEIQELLSQSLKSPPASQP